MAQLPPLVEETEVHPVFIKYFPKYFRCEELAVGGPQAIMKPQVETGAMRDI